MSRRAGRESKRPPEGFTLGKKAYSDVDDLVASLNDAGLLVALSAGGATLIMWMQPRFHLGVEAYYAAMVWLLLTLSPALYCGLLLARISSARKRGQLAELMTTWSVRHPLRSIVAILLASVSLWLGALIVLSHTDPSFTFGGS